MKPFASLLVPLDGSRAAAESLGCAAWLAEQLTAELHVINATRDELPPREALERLKVPEEVRPRVILHQAAEYPEKAVVEAIEQHEAELVVMTARGAAVESGESRPQPPNLLGHVARSVAERSSVPVLLIPPRYRERLPWTSILVPISGEFEADEALALAVRLANALGLRVLVAHVVGAEDEGLAATVRYADAPHHEYPNRLEELVSRLLPECTPEECACIEDVLLCRGDPGELLFKLAGERQVSVLVMGWHARFARGHSNVVKQVLTALDCPVLLVKAAPPAPFKLSVGEEIE
ncbi:MAG TPA: universal stress protein [Gammaproteobacteria bacterium]|nr:universal stress protein [Gammaproteobacteria bacterium]